METLLWFVVILFVIVFIDMLGKLTKYEKVLKDCENTDTNKLYKENKKLKEQVEDLSDALDDIQKILDDFEDDGK